MWREEKKLSTHNGRIFTPDKEKEIALSLLLQLHWENEKTTDQSSWSYRVFFLSNKQIKEESTN